MSHKNKVDPIMSHKNKNVNPLQVIINEKLNAQIRTLIKDDGEVWFVAKDVADILGYINSRKALANHVDEEDKKVINLNTVTNRDGTSGNPNMTVINESGLYSLIFSSKLETAKEFKRWVTSEVLPSIRKYGFYTTEEYGYGGMTADQIGKLIIESHSSGLKTGHQLGYREGYDTGYEKARKENYNSYLKGFHDGVKTLKKGE